MSDATWHRIFNFDDYGQLLALLQNSVLACLVLGVVGGLVSTFVMMRDLPFAVHGISELSFGGAALALLLGVNVVLGSVGGSLLAAAIIGSLGVRARDRNSIIGVLMPFGLGLGILFLSLYQGRAANKFGLLTGQIVAVDAPQLSWLALTAAVVVVGLVVIWRPLTFASVDAEVAAARGVPLAVMSFTFMLLVGLVVAISVQIVGALLVLSVVCTPGAAAARVTRSPVLAPVLAVAFAVTSTVGGILIALGSSVPISPYITTISFSIYVICRVIEWRRRPRSRRRTEPAPTSESEPATPVPSDEPSAAVEVSKAVPT